MTEYPAITADAAPERTAAQPPTRATPAAIVAIAVLVGAAAKVWFFVWHSPYDPRDFLPYDEFVKISDGWWAVHFFGGMGMALGFAAVAIAACLVVPAGRGAAWTAAGVVITPPGALLLGAGAAGEGVAMGYAADAAAVPATEGALLLQYMHDNGDLYLIGLLTGLALVTLGGLLLGIGLLRARALPVWVPVALIIGTILLPGTPFAIAWLASLPATVAAVAIGWYAWHASPSRLRSRSTCQH